MLVVDSGGKLKEFIDKVVTKAGRKDYLLSVRKQNVGLPAKEIIRCALHSVDVKIKQVRKKNWVGSAETRREI